MKDSKEYSDRIRKLYRSLKRKYPKVEQTTYGDPVEALVYACLSEHLSEKDARAAFRRLAECFVDLNDLRVSRPDEIVEAIGQDTPVTRQIAATITAALRNVFNQYQNVSLEALKRMGKRPARRILEEMEDVSKFAVDYCMLTALGAYAIPLTATMVAYLRECDFVHPEADEQQIGGFIARQVTAKNAFEFYTLLRRESESATKRKKSRKKSKRKTRKKTKKKKKKAKK